MNKLGSEYVHLRWKAYEAANNKKKVSKNQAQDAYRKQKEYIIDNCIGKLQKHNKDTLGELKKRIEKIPIGKNTNDANALNIQKAIEKVVSNGNEKIAKEVSNYFINGTIPASSKDIPEDSKDIEILNSRINKLLEKINRKIKLYKMVK